VLILFSGKVGNFYLPYLPLYDIIWTRAVRTRERLMSEAKPRDFYDTGKEVELDSKRRLTLGKVAEPTQGVRYRILHNDLGQILLNPVKSVPLCEAWIYENPVRLASIKRGIEQAKVRKVKRINLGS
jgi:hypothetical protein